MVRRIVFGLGVFVAISLTGLSTYIGIGQMRKAGASSTPVDGPAQRSAVIDVAKTAVTRLFDYAPDTIGSLPATASPLLTGDFRTEFSNKVRDEIVPQVQQQKMTSQVNVVGAAVGTLTADSASILVFMNQTVTAADKQPVYNGSRLRVQLSKQNDSWLVQKLDPI